MLLSAAGQQSKTDPAEAAGARDDSHLSHAPYDVLLVTSAT